MGVKGGKGGNVFLGHGSGLLQVQSHQLDVPDHRCLLVLQGEEPKAWLRKSEHQKPKGLGLLMASLWCFLLSNLCLNDDQKAFTFSIYKATWFHLQVAPGKRDIRRERKRERERERKREREREKREREKERERVFSASKQFGLKNGMAASLVNIQINAILTRWQRLIRCLNFLF